MKLFDKFPRRNIFENLKAPCKKERKNGIESQKEDYYRRGGGSGRARRCRAVRDGGGGGVRLGSWEVTPGLR